MLFKLSENYFRSRYKKTIKLENILKYNFIFSTEQFILQFLIYFIFFKIELVQIQSNYHLGAKSAQAFKRHYCFSKVNESSNGMTSLQRVQNSGYGGQSGHQPLNIKYHTGSDGIFEMAQEPIKTKIIGQKTRKKSKTARLSKKYRDRPNVPSVSRTPFSK